MQNPSMGLEKHKATLFYPYKPWRTMEILSQALWCFSLVKHDSRVETRHQWSWHQASGTRSTLLLIQDKKVEMCTCTTLVAACSRRLAREQPDGVARSSIIHGLH